jgi:hypothetical protein
MPAVSTGLLAARRQARRLRFDPESPKAANHGGPLDGQADARDSAAVTPLQTPESDRPAPLRSRRQPKIDLDFNGHSSSALTTIQRACRNGASTFTAGGQRQSTANGDPGPYGISGTLDGTSPDVIDHDPGAFGHTARHAAWPRAARSRVPQINGPG